MLLNWNKTGFGIFVDVGSEWDANVSSISLAASLGWVNGLANPIIGQLSDKYGPKIVMVFCSIFVSISSILATCHLKFPCLFTMVF